MINSTQPIVEADGTMSQVMRSWMLDIENRLTALETIYSGSGTPEGSVDAPLHSVYVDTDAAGNPDPLTYRKVYSDIAGDTTKGWLLVEVYPV